MASSAPHSPLLRVPHFCPHFAQEVPTLAWLVPGVKGVTLLLSCLFACHPWCPSTGLWDPLGEELVCRTLPRPRGAPGWAQSPKVPTALPPCPPCQASGSWALKGWSRACRDSECVALAACGCEVLERRLVALGVWVLPGHVASRASSPALVPAVVWRERLAGLSAWSHRLSPPCFQPHTLCRRCRDPGKLL